MKSTLRFGDDVVEVYGDAEFMAWAINEYLLLCGIIAEKNERAWLLQEKDRLSSEISRLRLQETNVWQRLRIMSKRAATSGERA